MKTRLLIAYQTITGLSDTITGLLLILSPALTLHLMGLSADPRAFTFLSFVGVFVLSVGLACLYGAWLATRPRFAAQLATVWLLTAIPRGLVAVFLFEKMYAGTLAVGWSSAAVSDGAFALLQLIGLYKGWLQYAEA